MSVAKNMNKVLFLVWTCVQLLHSMYMQHYQQKYMLFLFWLLMTAHNISRNTTRAQNWPAAITNFNFLLGDCHVNVQGCGPCLGSDVSGGIVGVCVGIGPGVVLMLVHVVVSVLVSTLLVNTRILSLRMKQQQMHGKISPQQGCRLLPKTHWLDPTIRLRWGSQRHHNLRWHKEHCQPLHYVSGHWIRE